MNNIAWSYYHPSIINTWTQSLLKVCFYLPESAFFAIIYILRAVLQLSLNLSQYHVNDWNLIEINKMKLYFQKKLFKENMFNTWESDHTPINRLHPDMKTKK